MNVITSSNYIIFAFALSFIDVSIASILFETWPIFMVIAMARMFRNEGHYRKITSGKWFLFIVAFFGVAFVISSQSETFDVLNEVFNYTAMTGVGLVIIAAVFGGIEGPLAIKWGAIVAGKAGKDKDDKEFFTLVAMTISKSLSGGIFLVISWFVGESIYLIGSIGVGIAIGFGVVNGAGGIFWRIANLKTTNLAINALGYITPVITLVWLAIANLIKVPHIDWLMIGVAAIITANLLLSAKVDVRSAYKALIIALWVCGTVIYLHDGFGLSGYAENVGMVATVFILILAFRLDRLVRRTADEERDEFLLFRRLSTLADQDVIDEDAPNQLRKIDKHTKPSDLQRAYAKLHEYFVDARENCKGDDRVRLDELQALSDTVAHSKQQGDNFGELTALGFLGFIMVGALLFFKPHELIGWEGLFVETTAFLLATTIIFLFFSIFDLQHDRTNAIFQETKYYDSHSVAFDDASNRSGERWVSIAVCIAIIATYIWLFMGKWGVSLWG